MTIYDFEDGNGPVPAHQHPNGGGWVADTAIVADTAYIGPNAQVFDNAKVYDNAKIYGNALVFGNAQVYGNAKVYGYARVYGNTWASEYAQVYEYARVFGNAKVFGNAEVFGDAYVYGTTMIYDNAKVSSIQHVKFGDIKVDLSLRENIKESIEAQCNLGTMNNYVYCYKRVNSDLTSEHDSSFIYPETGIVEEKNYDPDENKSCAKGLHFSHLSYYTRAPETKILFAKVHLDDVITCLEGKIRVKKAEILGIVE